MNRASAALAPGMLAALPQDRAGARERVHRLVAADLDAVGFFEELTPGADLDSLLAVLSLTSPAVTEAIGDPGRVPAGDRAEGPGAGWVMPAFTRGVRPSRFSDGRFGVWYVAWDLETAIAEKLHHEARRLRETDEPAQPVALQVLVADVAGFAAVLANLDPPLDAAIHHPDSYAASQRVGHHLRDRGSEAIVYRSVRRAGGFCTGVLRPRAVRHARRDARITLTWDGSRLTAGPLPPPASR